jgi:hypothetical protein
VNDPIGTTAARPDGFYWVILGQNPPEIAYWERGEWWLEQKGECDVWPKAANGRLPLRRSSL